MKYFFLCLLICLSSAVFPNSGVRPSPKITAPGSGKLLSDYIALHLRLVRDTKGLSQGQLFRQFTYISIAVYESIVNGDNRYISLGGQLQELDALPKLNVDKNTCWEASANATMAAMLKTFYSTNARASQMIDSLKNSYELMFFKQGYTKDHIQKVSGYGESVAQNILNWSKNDGSSKTHPAYEVPKGDGLWEATPPAFGAPLVPYAYNNRTCVKNSTENTLPVPPTPFSTDSTSAFYKMVNEVYSASTNLTAEQKALALFWDDFPDGRYYGAAGHWASILKQVVDAKQLSLIEAAEAYAKMNIGIMDGFSACWKGKYTYNVLRPVTYIRKYMGQPDWTPLIITPAHPEYPAAHASISMAAATALTKTLGDNVSFTDHSYDDLGYAPRSFKSFIEAGKEAGLSRLYGGIHYRPSIEAGYLVGEKTATNALNGLNFKRKPNK
ncbi:MAG TPA: vanadium-dependent haloperoxidase [Flavitalea sp.]|nr:vanadium-dependent haloperoxidase [Flavitalea sp.]